MDVVFIAVTILFGLVVLLLAAPVGVAFQLEGIEAITGQVAIRWLFGLVRFRVLFPGAEKRRLKSKAQRKVPTAKPEVRARRRRVLAMIRQQAFRERVYRLVGDFLRAAHLQEFSLRMRLGLGDPSDTGRLWAVVGPVSAAAHGVANADVRIEPDFVDAVLEFRAHGRAMLIPLQLLGMALVFLLAPPSLRAWRILMTGHA